MSASVEGRMLQSSDRTITVKTCMRCGGAPVFAHQTVVPGDPQAPRGSHRAVAHEQPAWVCSECGYVEPQERRRAAHREDVQREGP
jgi:ribosomal protein S27AE